MDTLIYDSPVSMSTQRNINNREKKHLVGFVTIEGLTVDQNK